MQSRTSSFDARRLAQFAPLWGLYTLALLTGQLTDLGESMDYLYELGGVNHAHTDILL